MLWHTPCRHCETEPWLMFRLAAISSTVTMASAAAVDSGVTTQCAWPRRGASATEVTPFLNILLHLYTCCSAKHASPCCTFIQLWISIGFVPSLLRKLMTTFFFICACSKWGSHCKMMLWQHFACLQYEASCWAFLKTRVAVLPTYRPMAQEIKSLWRLSGFHLTPPHV